MKLVLSLTRGSNDSSISFCQGKHLGCLVRLKTTYVSLYQSWVLCLTVLTSGLKIQRITEKTENFDMCVSIPFVRYSKYDTATL